MCLCTQEPHPPSPLNHPSAKKSDRSFRALLVRRERGGANCDLHLSSSKPPSRRRTSNIAIAASHSFHLREAASSFLCQFLKWCIFDLSDGRRAKILASVQGSPPHLLHSAHLSQEKKRKPATLKKEKKELSHNKKSQKQQS